MNAQIQDINTASSHAPQAISAMDAMMNAEIMTHVNNLAQVMASSKVTVPKHLQGSVSYWLNSYVNEVVTRVSNSATVAA